MPKCNINWSMIVESESMVKHHIKPITVEKLIHQKSTLKLENEWSNQANKPTHTRIHSNIFIYNYPIRKKAKKIYNTIQIHIIYTYDDYVHFELLLLLLLLKVVPLSSSFSLCTQRVIFSYLRDAIHHQINRIAAKKKSIVWIT